MIKEDLIQFVWQYGLFNQAHLKTLQHKELKIFKTGELNTNQGPDFLNCKIQIEDIVWAGNVEIHVNTSDFYKHKHHLDPAYKNIILHVVFENDIAVGDTPVLELKSLISKNIITRFVELNQNKKSIPCSEFINTVNDIVKSTWLQRLSIQRLENKCENLNNKLMLAQMDWETVCWQNIFKYSGGTVNKTAFELLAQNIDFKLLFKNSHKPFFTEAYLFGTAGMLNENYSDEYYQNLKKEFQFIKHTYQINELNNSIWKYMRMRPASFPGIRISQLANLINLYPRIFKEITDKPELNYIFNLFETSANTYWNNHYKFGETSELIEIKKMGKTIIDNLIINAIVPVLFSYGKTNNNPLLEELALNILEKLAPENNRIVREFKQVGLNCQNASDSQALIELKTNYCNYKKCLNCNIGSKIFRNFVN